MCTCGANPYANRCSNCPPDPDPLVGPIGITGASGTPGIAGCPGPQIVDEFGNPMTYDPTDKKEEDICTYDLKRHKWKDRSKLNEEWCTKCGETREKKSKD